MNPNEETMHLYVQQLQGRILILEEELVKYKQLVEDLQAELYQ